MRLAIPCILVLLFAVGCIKVVDPHTYVLSGDMNVRKQKDDEINSMLKLLSKKEADIVRSYEQEAFDAQDLYHKKVPDRTIAQVIDWETNTLEGFGWDITMIEPPKEGTMSPTPQPQANPQAAQQQAAMQNLIQLSVMNKQAVVNDAGRIQPGDQVMLTIGIGNKATKDIRAIKGRVVASDASGTYLSTADMDLNTVLARGKITQWLATFNLNGPQDKKFLDIDQNQVKLEFQPQSIVFADGTTMSGN